MALARRVGALTGLRRRRARGRGGRGDGAGAAAGLLAARCCSWRCRLLFWLLDGAAGPRAAFALGWAAGAGYFAAALFWIVEPFLVEPEVYGWMAPFALVGMAGGHGAVLGGALRAGARVPAAAARRGRWCSPRSGRWPSSPASQVLTGFPWALVGYAWVETPVIQTVALVRAARARAS